MNCLIFFIKITNIISINNKSGFIDNIYKFKSLTSNLNGVNRNESNNHIKLNIKKYLYNISFF